MRIASQGYIRRDDLAIGFFALKYFENDRSNALNLSEGISFGAEKSLGAKYDTF